MKSFTQFLFESTAVQQAKRMGLTGDGHGGWYKDGEFVAKTEGGKLKFYNKRQRVGQDPKQSEQEKRLSHSSGLKNVPSFLINLNPFHSIGLWLAVITIPP